MNLSKTLNTFITVLLCLTALVAPLSLPLPKVFILAALALLLLAAWAGRIFVEGKVALSRSPFDLPLLAILGIFTAATVLSQSPYYSLLGFYGNFYPSLIGMVSLLIVYFVVASEGIASKLATSGGEKNSSGVVDLPSGVVDLPSGVVDLPSGVVDLPSGVADLSAMGRITSKLATSKLITLTWFASVSTLSLVVILETFGIRWGALRLGGAPLQTALLAVLTLPLGLELLIKTKSPWIKSLLGIGTLVCFVTALIFATTSIYILLGVVTAAFLLLIPEGQLKENASFLVVPTALALLSLIVIEAPAISQRLGISRPPRELTLDTRTSWRVTAATFADLPILGSGPGTFLTDFTKYRPATFNTNPFWNVRFTRPVNDLFLIFCELGLLGILGFFYLGRAILKTVKPWGAGHPGLMTFLLGSLLGWVLVPSSLGVQIIFFLGLGLLTAGGARNYHKFTLPKAASGAILVVVTLLLAGGGYWIWRLSTAELAFARAQRAIVENRGVEAYESLGEAILKNPYSDLYRRNYAQINLGLANNLAAQETPSDEDKETISQLVQQAIREARIASERLGPQNVANWEVRAQIYRGITGLAQDAEQWVVDSLQTAIRLDPTNPLLRIDLGGMFFAQEDHNTAAAMFADAVRLKPDLANAHYNLAWALKGLGDIGGAVTQMELATRLVPEESEDYQRAAQEAEDWRAELPVEESEEMPTVEELEGVTEELEEASPSAQPPLEKPE